MIGFFGYFSSQGESLDQKFHSMEKALSYHGDRFNRDFIEGPGYKFCLRRHIKSSQGFAYSDDTFDVLVDGIILAVGYEYDFGNDFAVQELLRLYNEKGTDIANEIEGEFNLLVINKKTRTLFYLNDRYGLRPQFWGSDSNAIYFGIEGKQVCAGLGFREFDNNYVGNYLSYGRGIVGDYTLFKGVRMIPSATLFEVDEKGATTRVYWRTYYSAQPFTKGKSEKIAGLLLAAIRRRFSDDVNYGITLSGGLDSRLVAAGIAKILDQPFTSVTFGLLGSDEVRFARETAAILGTSEMIIPLGPADFISNALPGCRFSEGLDLFVQSYGIDVYSRMAEKVQTGTTGLALDLTLGGSYIDESLTDQITETAVFQNLLKRFRYFDLEETGKLLPDFGEKVYSDVTERIRAISTLLPGETSADASDRLALEYRCHRVIFLRQFWQRLYLDDSTPTFDYAFLDEVMTIPSSERINHKAYMKIFNLIAESVAHIPYQRTGLPATIDPSYWKEAERIENEREKLYDRINQERGFTASYPRYSTNYGDWFKYDLGWRTFLDELTGSNYEHVYKDLGVSLPYVKEMLIAHRSGEKDNRQKLLQIVSLVASAAQAMESIKP